MVLFRIVEISVVCPVAMKVFKTNHQTILRRINSRFEHTCIMKAFNIASCVHLPNSRGEFLYWKQRHEKSMFAGTNLIRETDVYFTLLDLNVCQITCFYWQTLCKLPHHSHLELNSREKHPNTKLTARRPVKYENVMSFSNYTW